MVWARSRKGSHGAVFLNNPSEAWATFESGSRAGPKPGFKTRSKEEIAAAEAQRAKEKAAKQLADATPDFEPVAQPEAPGPGRSAPYSRRAAARRRIRGDAAAATWIFREETRSAARTRKFGLDRRAP